jgi:predicted outer membrane protein
MKKNFKHITTALAVCAGLVGTVASTDAQTTTPRTPSSSSSRAGTSGTSSSGSMSQMDDQAFAQKAMEANMAEIMMAKLALQKGASAKVKEFAQMMIDEHGSANDQLKAIVSGVAMSAPEQMGTGTAATGGAMGNTGATGSSTTGATTGATTTASGATSPGTTDHSTTGHAGSHATTGATGTTGSGSTSVGTTGTSGNNAPEQMGTGTTGTGATTSPSGATSPGSVNSGTMGHAGNHATAGTGSADFDDPTMLSPEHRTMMDKLTKLTGASFDREYMQGQVKDHAKTAALFESQSKNGQDARLKEYATTLLPSIRKHGQMASDIANSMRSGSSKAGSSGE